MRKVCCLGGAGYRSRYLSHAKRALYHLSYAPWLNSFCFHKVFDAYVRKYTVIFIWQNLSNRYLTTFWWMFSYKSFTVHKLFTITNFCCRRRATLVCKIWARSTFLEIRLDNAFISFVFLFLLCKFILTKGQYHEELSLQDIYRNSNQHHSNNKIILSWYTK